MANRYWVGGTGTWDTTSTAKWAAAAGLSFTASTTGTNVLTTVGSPALVIGMTVFNAAGTSLGTITGGSANTWTLSTTPATQASQPMTAQTVGASVPTTSDSVIINANSGAGTITLSGALNCQSLDFTFGGNAVMVVAGTGTINVSTSMALSPTTTWNATSTLTFSSTAAGRILTSNGRTFACSLTFNGVGGVWTLTDALTSTGTIALAAGTLITSGFAVSALQLTSNGSTTRTLNITNSSVTVSAATGFSAATTGLTFTSTGSTITCTSGAPTFSSPGLTFNTVQFTSTSISLGTINGANTFANLTITNKGSVGVSFYAFGANQTVTGTFTLASNGGASSRTMLVSDFFGTNRTITAAAVSLGDVDFRNITGAGAASWTGTRLGDATGNSGITFATPKNVYWNLAGSQSWLSNGWAATSGGSPAVTNYPLPQDTAFIEGVGTAISIGNALNLPNIDLLTASSAVVLQFNVASSIYGFLKLGTANPTGTALLSFQNQDANESITSNGRTLSCPVTIDCFDTTVSITDNLFCSNTLTLTSGTFSDGGVGQATFTTFSSTGAATRQLNISFGIACNGTGTVWTASGTNLTMNVTGYVALNNTTTTARTFAGGGYTYGQLWIYGAGGANTTTITGSNTIGTILTNKTVAYTVSFTAGTTTTIGTWSLGGSAGNLATINSTTAGTQATLAITNKTTSINYLAIQDINSSNTTPVTFWAGANSTNNGNNTGIAFASGATTAAYILTTVGAGSFTTPGDWNNSANNIYLFGGGGGGAGGVNNTTTNARSAGAGGGGGGFTLLTNQTISGAVSYAIGAGGTAGAGVAAAGVQTSTAGAGGTTNWKLVTNTISYIGQASFRTTTTSNTVAVSISALTSSMVAGDLLVVATATGYTGAGTWSTPAGWTETQDASNRLVAWAVWDGSTSSYTFTTTTSAIGNTAVILVFRNASFGIQGVLSGAAGSTTVTAPSITTTVNSTVLAIYNTLNATLGTVSYTTPTGYTEVFDDAGGLAVNYQLNVAAGATGDAISTASSGTNSRGVLVSLSPTLSYLASATGGTGGSASTATPSSTGGTGGTGTYTGGTGGIGGAVTALNIVAGGGGAGAAGVNGNGANGGIGNTNATNANASAGGGGGNGGGTAGGNGAVGVSGAGGNNSSSAGGGASVNDSNGTTGVRGGGGSGAEGTPFRGGVGGNGADVLNGFGSGGGSGGSTNLANTPATAGLYGAGGGGGGSTATSFAGAAGAQGAIIIVYTISGGTITADITENSGLADILSALGVFERAATENVNLADINTSLLNTSATSTENVSLADTKTALFTTSASSTENVSLADIKSTLLTTSATSTENVNLADTPSANYIVSATITENLTLADIKATINLFSAAISENVNLASIETAANAYLVSIVEAQTAASIQTTQTTLTAAQVENQSLADIKTVVGIFNAIDVENVSLADTKTAVKLLSSAAIENLSLAEFEAYGNTFNDSITESLFVDDDSIGYKLFTSSIIEAASLADQSTRALLFIAESTEGIAVADSVSRQAIFASFISENMVMLEQLIGYGWFKVENSQTESWTQITWGSTSETGISNTLAESALGEAMFAAGIQAGATTLTWRQVENEQDNTWVLINNSQENNI